MSLSVCLIYKRLFHPPAASSHFKVQHFEQGGTMPNHLLKVLLIAGLCGALLPAVAFPKDHGKGHDRDDENHKQATHHYDDHDKHHDRDHHNERDRNRDKPPTACSQCTK